ncbi:hypothetical protein ECANGB1_2237 [Enterospora canceri]|uniref:Homeobox domain-containing protein n=1 Tax=Enterospora canceri TaxID=1081671 RepID=A0A1Y1S4W8_9MICR|nr:hypothetical protein ECANGB1_2237 [Enterospora canceri]
MPIKNESQIIEYNTLVNDAFIGFLKLVQQNKSETTSRLKKTKFEVHVLESIFRLIRYPSKSLRRYICLITPLRYASVTTWFQNRRNGVTCGQPDLEAKLKSSFIRRSSISWSCYSNFSLADSFYANHDLGEFIKNDTFIKSKDAWFFKHATSCKCVAAEEFASLENLDYFDTCASDMLNMFLQKGIEIKALINKFYFESKTCRYTNNLLFDTDYLMCSVYSGLSKKHKMLFLKLRRRDTEK